MKKIILSAVAVFVAAASFAQAESGFSAAIGFGIEPYNYGGEEYYPMSLSCIFARGDYEYAFATHSAVSAGIRFDYVGVGDFVQIDNVETTWKKTYIDIPIKYNAHFGGFFINAGPVIKFLLSYKHKTENTATGASETINDLKDYPDSFNKVYFGLGAGIGYTFKCNLKIFADYDYNFTNIIKETGSGIPASSKPSLISFGVGFNF